MGYSFRLSDCLTCPQTQRFPMERMIDRSMEFEGVRVQMRKLYARFERQVFAIASL
jgi:hypothetical protein